jgi:hypothetical protein
VVLYRIYDRPDIDRKETSEIAKSARGFTLLISCTATEQSASAKKSGD